MLVKLSIILFRPAIPIILPIILKIMLGLNFNAHIAFQTANNIVLFK